MPPTEPRSRQISAAFLRRTDATTFTPNERRLLNLVRNEGPLSRAEIARRTDLAMQSVVRLVEGLLERGFVRTGEKVIRGVGQPSLPILLAEDAAFTVGASVMADAISLVLMDLSGKTLATSQEAVDGTDLKSVGARLHHAIDAMVARARIDRRRLFGAGVATTGYFVGSTELNTPTAMGDWALRDLEAHLSKALALPVWIENDGNAAAVGESLFGVGRRCRSFAYLYVAAGLGGGLILDGAPARGVHGNAGEFTGLLPLDGRPDRPNLGLLLELVRAGGEAVADVADMLARFDMGWPGVAAWLDRTQVALDAIVSAIGAVLDPEAIVIGGRLPPPLAAAMAARAQFYSAPVRDRERPFAPVVPAEAPGDAAALGAASIPLREHFFS